MLFVISAPSGAGKTTIIRELFKSFPGLKFSVSATTRGKRRGETNGKDYYFITKQDFEKKAKKGDFIEWEEVHGNLYGTLRTEIENKIHGTYDIVFDVDVLGALSIKQVYPESVIIFIDAPEKDLMERLKRRETEPEGDIKKRLKRMELELSYKDKFDHIVINQTGSDGIKNAVKEIIGIINKYREFKKIKEK